MNPVDILFLGVLSLTTLCEICFSVERRRVFHIALALLVLLALVQLIWKGFYWQYVPAYVLLVVLITLAWRTRSNQPSLLKNSLLCILLMATIAPWAVLLPVPTLTRPQGEYAVGTEVFRWVDSARTEQITADPRDKRNVIAQAWYPAESKGETTRPLYLDGLHHLPPDISGIPSLFFNQYGQIDTYATQNATVSKTQKNWPVVLLLMGYGAARAFYTSLAVGLASCGYVVFAIDHPYESMLTELADGRLVTTLEKFSKGDPDRLNFMENRLGIRVVDVQFVINQFGKKQPSSSNVLSSLDLNRIGIAGHSLGGAAGAAAMAHDARLKAAVNLDGTLYGKLPKPNGPRPFLLVESNKSEVGHFERYEAGNQLLFNQFGGGYRYEIVEADHYSFTDVPLLLAPPTRFLVGHFLKVGQIHTTTHTATVSLLDAFFEHTLNGKPSKVDAVASRYQGILRKQVKVN
ncbi:MAG: hypothetical protein EAZ91_14360 [Cytophagales bacterium]|nr:MAG: hypothetical protein EAZ91_14360 [Cytophagales bacterium]